MTQGGADCDGAAHDANLNDKIQEEMFPGVFLPDDVIGRTRRDFAGRVPATSLFCPKVHDQKRMSRERCETNLLR